MGKSDSQWKWLTSDKVSEWKQMIKQVTMNENKWEQVKQGDLGIKITITNSLCNVKLLHIQLNTLFINWKLDKKYFFIIIFLLKIYTFRYQSFWKYNIKQNMLFITIVPALFFG